jgi:2-C-methyl-D-erythritol 4-phosphate cytidylyltransferase
MEIIMPAAGLSTRFPNMRPKHTLTDYSGKMMFEKSLKSFIGKHHITIGLLREHEEKYNISKYNLKIILT